MVDVKVTLLILPNRSHYWYSWVEVKKKKKKKVEEYTLRGEDRALKFESN